MAEINIKFLYKSQEITIQNKSDVIFKNIFKQLEAKILTEKVYYLYSGRIIDSSKTFNEIANEIDKKENKMVILVNPIEEKDKYQPLSVKLLQGYEKKYEISEENTDIGEFLNKIKINIYDRIIILIKNGNYFWNKYYETPESVYILIFGEHFDRGYYYYSPTKNNIKITVKIDQLTNPCNACSHNNHLSYTKLKILRDSTVEIIGIDFIENINPINEKLCPGGSGRSVFALFGDNNRLYLCENSINFTCSLFINVLFFGIGKVFFHNTYFIKNPKCEKEKVFVVGAINGWNAGAKAFIYSGHISLDKDCLLFNKDDKSQYIEYVNH